MKAKFEVFVTIFMLLVGCFVLYSQGSEYLRGRAMYLHPGDRLPAIKDINWANNDRTLLLMVRKGCHYCDESIPFYKKIASVTETRQKTAFVAAVVPDDAKPEQQLFRAYQLNIPIVGNVPFNKLKITGTPTLVLVDRQGKVQKLWVGQLNPAGESEVIAAIGG